MATGGNGARRPLRPPSSSSSSSLHRARRWPPGCLPPRAAFSCRCAPAPVLHETLASSRSSGSAGLAAAKTGTAAWGRVAARVPWRSERAPLVVAGADAPSPRGRCGLAPLAGRRLGRRRCRPRAPSSLSPSPRSERPKTRSAWRGLGRGCLLPQRRAGKRTLAQPHGHARREGRCPVTEIDEDQLLFSISLLLRK